MIVRFLGRPGFIGLTAEVLSGTFSTCGSATTTSTGTAISCIGAGVGWGGGLADFDGRSDFLLAKEAGI